MWVEQAKQKQQIIVYRAHINSINYQIYCAISGVITITTVSLNLLKQTNYSVYLVKQKDKHDLFRSRNYD